MLAYLKFELRRMYREPRLLVFTIAMPVILAATVCALLVVVH